MINLELFSCSGGMAEGFRRAGLRFDIAVDFAADHCDSYERNLGHRPQQLDVRDLLRDVEAGRVRWEVDLLVADPPCTPWSRAGKRLGTGDERDMLEVTCQLIAALRPRRYLIGNVPGLDDMVNLPIVRRHIGGLVSHGYCTADFARLDAADYGVPQHRIRPFWFGHREGPCWRAPSPTHDDPRLVARATLPGIEPLRPWVTCREALGHLTGDDLGRPVRMRKRDCHGKQLGSVADRPARTVGTSNLSDGNTLAMHIDKHAPSDPDAPSKTIGAKSRGNGACAIAVTRHEQPVHTSEIDAPARAITTQCRAPGHATTLVLSFEPHHPPSYIDEPAMTVRAGGGGGANRALQLTPRTDPKKRPPQGPQSSRVGSPDAPATTVQARENRVGSGSPTLEWPWERPSTTVTSRAGLPPPGHHDESFAIMSLPDAIVLSERAAAILQGFPDDGSWTFCGRTKKARWSQIGQAMPPALAEAVARAIVEQDRAARGGSP